MERHNKTVKEMAKLMGFDEENFTALNASDYIDTIWARYFEQIYDMGPFNKTFIDEMMLLQLDYYNQTLGMNETTRKLYVTGVISHVVNTFRTRILQDSMKPPVNDKNILKFFFWSDHDDSIIELTNAFSFHLDIYPKFASQIIFELWRHGNISDNT